MYKIYGDMLSGNCYKIKLLVEYLNIPHEWVHVDILNKETHSDGFKKMNPNTRIPVLDLGDGRYLWESNAILNFLAHGTELLPNDAYTQAKILQWQFFEQYSHEPYIATARYINKYLGLPKEREAEYHGKQAGGHSALRVMNDHLSQHEFFVGAQYSIADISLFAYTHVAHEGGFDLSNYPHILAWITRVQSMPHFVKMIR
ncbi:MAG: glutathione S-transferase family protein [Bermanella sp.]